MLETRDRQSEERYRNRWYGKYRAFVRDNNDPERLGRIRLEIPAVLGSGRENWSEWAAPCFPYGGNDDTGMFLIPEEGVRMKKITKISGWGNYGGDNAPIIEVSMYPKGSKKQSRFWCSECDRYHYHGYCDDDDGGQGSHRAAHCGSEKSMFWKSGYFLKNSGR